MQQALIKITGIVQGVCYRANAQKAARSLNLTGYAKNMPDGSVQALVQGEKQDILKFIEWCNKGSESAEVKTIETNWQEATKKLSEFKIY